MIHREEEVEKGITEKWDRTKHIYMPMCLEIIGRRNMGNQITKISSLSGYYVSLFLYPYEGAQAMQASKRMAEEAPSSSRLELDLLNLLAFPLLHCICFCWCWYGWCCGCCSCFPFVASSTFDTIFVITFFSPKHYEREPVYVWETKRACAWETAIHASPLFIAFRSPKIPWDSPIYSIID